MKRTRLILILTMILLYDGCVVQFIPEVDEDQQMLVVEGLVTDQYGPNTIRLTRSLPVSGKRIITPLRGCTVEISDDLGGKYSLQEKTPGNYETNPATFRGRVGRKYTLYIHTTAFAYQSVPVEMLPVPQVDSVYYEKASFSNPDEPGTIAEGCQIYLDTHDPSNKCRYFRWSYSETWEFHIPYSVTNRICWKSGKSGNIFIRNTSVLQESSVTKFPLNFISNNTDRLSVKYSILVNQYSLSEDEYHFWEKLQAISDNVGSLYDITPSTVTGNITCISRPEEKVLGYFSVSAVSGKRIFIKDTFRGIPNFYSFCPSDTITGGKPIPGLNETVWIIVEEWNGTIPTRVLTQQHACADCTLDGTNVKPSFWTNN